MAKFVVVFNCSEGMDYATLNQAFCGLIQTGCWGCLDEFNRIRSDVLSVIGQQFSTILSAMSNKKAAFEFEGKQMRLNPGFGLFITMNPYGYGRSELPSNVKALFRPVSMMLPDIQAISEVLLYSEGFKTATECSKKVTSFFDLLKKQVFHSHYDFGLRSVKAVLISAGRTIKIESTDSEETILIRAIRDLNLPKVCF